jgi:hypothetical protein
VGSLRPEEEGLDYFSYEKTQFSLLKRTHKFGIEVPKTIKEALELDKKNGSTFWADTISKEMKEFVSPSRSYLTDSLCRLATRRYPAT